MATVSDRMTALAAIAALALLAGCAPNAPALGEAVKYDMAIQTINPDPVYPAGSAEPGTNGDVARSAAERYRLGTVTPVETPSTSDVDGGKGSGSR